MDPTGLALAQMYDYSLIATGGSQPENKNFFNNIGGNIGEWYRNLSQYYSEAKKKLFTVPGFDPDVLLEKWLNGEYWLEFEEQENRMFAPPTFYGVDPVEKYTRAIMRGDIDPEVYPFDQFVNDMGPIWEAAYLSKAPADRVNEALSGLMAVFMGIQALNYFDSVIGYYEASQTINATSVQKEKIIAAIEQSKAARMSSNFGVYAAKEAQILGGYLPDKYSMVTIPKGTILYGGLPGQSVFYTDFKSVKASGLNKTVLWQGLQVRPHPDLGYRPQLGVYRVLQDLRVPYGEASANIDFGPGGFTQYYIQNFKSTLELIKTIDLK